MDIKIEPIEEDQPDLIDLNLLKTEQSEDLQCLTCSETFNCQFLLKVHQMLHDPNEYCFICKRKYPNNIDVHVLGKHCNQCELCLKTFTEKKALRRHMELHTGELTYLKCNQCDKIFRQAGSLTVHIRATHQGLKPFSCTICQVPVNFTTNSALKRHLKKFHNPNSPRIDYIKIQECSFCHEPQRGWKMKRDHENQHRASKICKSCDKVFKNLLEMRKHFALDHAAPGWFPCEECWMNFNSTYLLKKHTENHQGKRYSCQECDLSYINRSSLHKHRRIYHNPNNPTKIDQNNLKCRYCSETFLSIRQRQIHTLKICRAKVKPVCQICQKHCPSTYSLSRHMRRSHTHLDTCPHCQKEYSQGQLKRHLKNIHQERKCHHCGEVFYIYERYHVHLLSHNVDIRCDVCGKDLRMDNIEKHMQKRHQKNVPKEECKYCRKTVANLNIHVANVHTCPLCDLYGKLFSTMGLRVHYKMHHPQDIKCSKCDQNVLISQIKSHVWKVHNRKRFFLCDKCGILFYNPGRYKRHIMRHLVCTIGCMMCGRRFIDERMFRVHRCVKKRGWKKIKAGNPDKRRYHSTRIILSLGEHQAIENKRTKRSGKRNYRCKTCFKHLTALRSAKKHHCGENREIGRRKFCKLCGLRFFTKNAARMRDHILRCQVVKTENESPDYVNGENNLLLQRRDFKVEMDVEIEETEGFTDVECVLKKEYVY